MRWRTAAVQTSSSLPIVAVDGLGKTTSSAARCAFILALVRRLMQRGQAVHVWVRGPNTRQVRLFHKPKSPSGMGEEAFVLSQEIPVWVSKNPEGAIIAAAQAGADILLLANRSEVIDALAQFSIAVMDEGIGAVEPAGWEPYWPMLARSDALVLVDGVRDILEGVEALQSFQSFLWKAPWTLKEGIAVPSAERPLLAFTGLNDAGAFYRALLKEGVAVRGFTPLSYSGKRSEKALKALCKTAEAEKAALVTTEHDMPFLPAKVRKKVTSFPLRAEIPEGLVEAILEILPGKEDTAVA